MERDCLGGDTETVHRHGVNRRVGLEDADILDREDGVEQAFDAGVADRRGEHFRGAVGQDGTFQPAVLEFGQHRLDLGVGVELKVTGEKLVAQVRIVDTVGLEGEVQGVAGDLPEIHVVFTAHEAAQPSVLQLFVAPGLGYRASHVAQVAAIAGRRRMDVEQGAVGIEHAGAHLLNRG